MPNGNKVTDTAFLVIFSLLLIWAIMALGGYWFEWNDRRDPATRQVIRGGLKHLPVEEVER
jgi:hypothetical protein